MSEHYALQHSVHFKDSLHVHKEKGRSEVSPLTDERCDDVVHALQEAGQVLRGRVVRWGDLSHDGRCLGPGSLHAAVVRQDVSQAQDPIHLQATRSPLGSQLEL